MGPRNKRQERKQRHDTRRGDGRPTWASLHGQDGWANIWGAALAEVWPRARVGRRSFVRAGRSGGAAVALASSKPYIIPLMPDFKWDLCGSAPSAPAGGGSART